jgi:hypothetical protein
MVSRSTTNNIGNSLSRVFEGFNYRRSSASDDVYFQPDQLFCQHGKALDLTPRPSVFDNDVLSFNIAQPTKKCQALLI